MNKEHECGGTNNGTESLSRSLGHRWFSKVSSLFKGKTLNDDIWDELEREKDSFTIRIIGERCIHNGSIIQECL